MSNSSLAHVIQYKPEFQESFVDFKCGNNLFSDMEWDFNDLLSDYKHLSGSRMKIKFQEWEQKPELLYVVKWYMVSVLLTSKWATAKRLYDGIKQFLKYTQTCSYHVDSFLDIDQTIVHDYFSYLLTVKSENNGKPLSHTSIQKAAQSFKDLLKRGNSKGWDVPKEIGFLDKLYDDMINNNKKSTKKKQTESFTNKALNKDILDNIITLALEDLREGEDVFPAASIIITTQVGLRINEFLTLKEDCLIQNSDSYSIRHYSRKLNNEEIEVIKPVNEYVVLAIQSLLSYTKSRRKESKLPFLFINPNRVKVGYPIELISHSTWGKNFLIPWIEKHNIQDENGNPLKVTSHTFRHCFATYAISNGASIEVVSEMMGHKSIRGTQHYAKTIEEDVKNRFAEVFNEGAILSGKKAMQIKEKLKDNNPFKGKTIEQVDSLRKAMKIQVLSHGLCTHHPMRNEPCMGDGVCLGCQNFLTTPEFLDIHKSRLANVQKQLAKTSENGPYESKLKHIEHYLVGIIDDLENQMKGKNQK